VNCSNGSVRFLALRAPHFSQEELGEAGEFELEVCSNPSFQNPRFTGTVHTHGLARRPPYGTNRPER
jgi:diphthamide synthase (EF-2-diphthine--ammonia ligase)